MTEVLADIFAQRVAAALPFLAPDAGGRAVGLARLYTTTSQEENPRPIKLPVPVSYTAADCERDARYLVPDASTPAILFFEDQGSQPLATAQFPASMGWRQASLRLLLWVNAPLLDGPLAEVALLAAVTRALRPGERQQLAPFADVLVSYQTLPAETSLFARYSFADLTPLLLPPHRLLGLSLTVQLRLNLNCLPATLPGVANPAPLCP